MPNWVTTECTITGDKQRIQEVKELLHGISIVENIVGTDDNGNPITEKYENVKVFSLNKIIPMPDHIPITPLSLDSKDDGDNWYDWRIENWGTKWDANWSELESEKDDELVYRFDTAWDYPAPCIKALSEKFTDLKIDCIYADGDYGFNVGKISYSGGEMVFCDIPKGNSEKALEIAEYIHGPLDDEYEVEDEDDDRIKTFDIHFMHDDDLLWTATFTDVNGASKIIGKEFVVDPEDECTPFHDLLSFIQSTVREEARAELFTNEDDDDEIILGPVGSQEEGKRYNNLDDIVKALPDEMIDAMIAWLKYMDYYTK